MRKRDLLTPAGITLGFVMIILAIVTQGSDHAASFLDISSIFIVLGGMAASLLINFKREELKVLGPVLKEAFHKKDMPLTDVVQLFVKLSERARREGLLALDRDMNEVDDHFIRKGISLVVDGMDGETIKEIMNAEITALEERHYRGRKIFEKCGEYAPAWGMIGTLVGLVLMLTTLDNPATLGPSMAVALLTTLYGTVLAHLVFLPLASKLENKTEEEIFMMQIIIEGVISVHTGQNPHIVEEKLSAFLSKDKHLSRVVQMGEKAHGA